ncbi:MAG: hypothetical protein HQ517_04840 [SAR324 cluster bacterium]|nr:hypothetical protein [SAR324 cluster bacterium]
MKICVFNLKGGVGKSVISLNLALTMGYNVVTNEQYGRIEDVLPEKTFYRMKYNQKKAPDFADDANIIFDLGGYVDTKVSGVLLQSDCVLVPVVFGTRDDVQVSINSINEIQSHNSNIIIIANRTRKGDLERLEKIFHKLFDYPILEVKQSTALRKIYENKVAIKDIVLDGGVIGYQYGPVAKQFTQIIRKIRGYKNESQRF